MIDFSSVTEIYLGGQAVTSIALNGQEIWTAGGGEDLYTLRFTPETNGNITFTGWKDTMNVEYSKDMKTWTSLITASTTVTVQAGETLYVRGNNPNGLSTSYNESIKINPSVKTIASGDVMSLLYPTEKQNTKVIPNNNCFCNLFNGASNIDIDDNFKLSATTLSEYCYNSMFDGCTKLTTAPVLPVTKLESNCYSSMFSGCTSLTTAPELPATTLTDFCYANMFRGCTSLTTAPELPATTLASSCYNSMFYGCTKLTTAPELPATTLVTGCYSYMFSGCTSLTTAPALPATTLASSCYSSMFRGCTSLTTAPALPATTLQQNCYNCMFYGCTKLTTAPELPATTLVTGCYYEMFNGCSKLNYIKVGATSWNTSYTTNNWVNNVSSTGTFVKPASTSIPTETYGIPSGWTVMTPEEYEQAEQAYTLRFTPETSGNITFSGLPSGKNVEYSTDRNTWASIPVTTTVDVPVQAGETLYVRGNNPNGLSTSSSAYLNINPSVKTIVSGDVMSLLYPTEKQNTKVIPNDYCFYRLVNSASNIDIDENFKLSATTLSGYCYAYMFYYCTSLTTAPELPATTLASGCYYNMFNGCTGLTTAPELPATTLTQNCYNGMFYRCGKLTSAPELPATTLANYCYQYMFRGCTGLTTAPELPATTLTQNCYNDMFNGCSKLNYIKVGTTSWNTSYTTDWVNSVSSTGTFVKPYETDIPTGTNGIPSGWTVQNIGGPADVGGDGSITEIDDEDEVL